MCCCKGCCSDSVFVFFLWCSLCMYMYMYVYVYMYIHVCIYVCMFVGMNICMQRNTHELYESLNLCFFSVFYAYFNFLLFTSLILISLEAA